MKIIKLFSCSPKHTNTNNRQKSPLTSKFMTRRTYLHLEHNFVLIRLRKKAKLSGIDHIGKDLHSS